MNTTTSPTTQTGEPPTTPSLVKGATEAVKTDTSPLDGTLGIVIVVLVAVVVLIIILVIIFAVVARHSSRADKYFLGTNSSSARSDLESVTPPNTTSL